MKVLYIMGAGHTGSTILDIVLGNHSHIEGVGELNKLHSSGWSGDGGRRCACGSVLEECSFWPEVRRDWAGRIGGDDVRRYVDLQKRFERSRSAWPRLLRSRVRPSAEFAEYATKTAALYEAILKVGGRSVVVDSSLAPRRAYVLSAVPGVDLHLVHLVRDGRGVIWSLKKPGKKTLTKPFVPAPAWRTTRYWISANLQCAWVFRGVDQNRRLRIRYEDFVTRPADVLERIGTLLGEDFSRVIAALRADHPIQVAGHTVGGNRVRMQKDIRVRPDIAWMEHLPEKDRELFWRLSGWLAKRYGYTRHPHP